MALQSNALACFQPVVSLGVSTGSSNPWTIMNYLRS